MKNMDDSHKWSECMYVLIEWAIEKETEREKERKKETEVKIDKRAKTSEQMEESWAHNEVNVANEKKNFTDFMSKDILLLLLFSCHQCECFYLFIVWHVIPGHRTRCTFRGCNNIFFLFVVFNLDFSLCE